MRKLEFGSYTERIRYITSSYPDSEESITSSCPKLDDEFETFSNIFHNDKDVDSVQRVISTNVDTMIYTFLQSGATKKD